MSQYQFIQQSMNGINDGSSDILEEGILNCDGVITKDIQTDNISVKNDIAVGESLAIGNNVAVGNSVVVPNIYTTKLFVSNILECKNIKTEKIKLTNNLQTYDEFTVGYIKPAPYIVSKPLLIKNENSTLTSLKLPIGVYVLNYIFDIVLSAESLPALHSITHGLSTNITGLDILYKQHYGLVDFSNPLSYVTINDTVFYHINNYDTTVYLLAVHNSVDSGVSNIKLENIKLSALRIA